MNTLLIDTASDLEIVVVSAGGKAFGLAGAAGKSHAVTLFETIHRCLGALSVAVGDMELLAVGIGPGSFTGIRIAVSTARMIAQVLAIPLVGIHSQEIYARSLPAEPGDQLLIAFDAKKGKVFGALYRLEEGDGLSVLAPPGDYDMEDLCGRADPGRTTVTAGNGITRYAGVVSSSLPGHRHHEIINPDAGRITDSIARKYAESPEKYRNYMNTVPQYARKSDAELLKIINNEQV